VGSAVGLVTAVAGVAGYLDAVAHRHGEWRGLDRLRTGGLADAAVVAKLAAGGLERYSVLTEHPRALYAGCVAETLDRAGVPAAEVDVVLFFSSTFAAYDDHADVAELCARTGMSRALPMGLFLAQCTNFSYALLVGTALLSRPDVRTVLLLGADALDEARGPRVLDDGVSVFSDSVVSCLLRAEGGPWAVDRVAHRFDAELVTIDPRRQIVKYLERFSGALGAVCAEAGPGGVSRLVLANLGIPVLRNYASVARLPFAAVCTDNLARLGHCFGHDQLITLDGQTGAADPGDRVLALGVGADYLFSAVTLTRTAEGTPA